MDSLPKSQDLIHPTMRLLAREAGPCSIDRIEAEVGRDLDLPLHLLSIIHTGTRTEFQYRLAWARTSAKSKGWIESPKREFWQITELGRSEFGKVSPT